MISNYLIQRVPLRNGNERGSPATSAKDFTANFAFRTPRPEDRFRAAVGNLRAKAAQGVRAATPLPHFGVT